MAQEKVESKDQLVSLTGEERAVILKSLNSYKAQNGETIETAVIPPIERPERAVGALQEIFNSQRKFQSFMGYDFDKMTPQERAAYVKEQMFWANDEMSEAIHELPYAKTWSKKYDKPEYDHEKQLQLFKEEMIDSLHFFSNALIAVGMTEEEVLKMYREKNKENYDRQYRGY